MNPEALLALIGDLYALNARLQHEVGQLKAQLAEARKPPE